MESDTVLVTGGAGFIGSHLCRFLIEMGHNVICIDNLFTGSIEKINEEKRKLEVMVKIFGRKTPLELSYMQVEKI